jgi:prophage maintenance system killer protein
MADTPGGEVLLYETPDGQVRLDVRLDRESVWLSLTQIAELFGRDKSVISRHLRNVFDSGELERSAVVAKNATTAADGKTYQVDYFNLDAILSVGYRVNSKRGTQFRIWATRTLREHLLRGYTLNERRLRERGLNELQQAVDLLARTLTEHALVTDEGQAVLEVVRQYARTWRWLLEYDENRLATTPARPMPALRGPTVDEARTAIARLRGDLGRRGETATLFGQERGDGLAGILGSIEQTFGGEPLYPSAQARAAHLLYFVIKDHPFADGNKRIGALLFLEYLRRNGLLVHPGGAPRLADNAMVALALLIAASAPAQKDLMVRLVLNLLGDESP